MNKTSTLKRLFTHSLAAATVSVLSVGAYAATDPLSQRDAKGLDLTRTDQEQVNRSVTTFDKGELARMLDEDAVEDRSGTQTPADPHPTGSYVNPRTPELEAG